jgi:hypothetical protein
MSRRWRVLGRLLMALGGLGLVGVVALQARQNVFSPQTKTATRCEMAVSSCLAECMLGDLAGQSGSVVLLFPQRRLMDADAERSFEEGFIPPLRHGRARLRVKALRLEGGDRAAGHDLSALKQALAQAPDALAIVSYAGVPAGFETLLASEVFTSPDSARPSRLCSCRHSLTSSGRLGRRRPFGSTRPSRARTGRRRCGGI